MILSEFAVDSLPGAQFWRRAGESSGPETCAAWGCPPGRTPTACWRCWRSPCSRSAPCCIARTTATAQTLPCSPYYASSANNVLGAATQSLAHRSHDTGPPAWHWLSRLPTHRHWALNTSLITRPLHFVHIRAIFCRQVLYICNKTELAVERVTFF